MSHVKFRTRRRRRLGAVSMANFLPSNNHGTSLAYPTHSLLAPDSLRRSKFDVYRVSSPISSLQQQRQVSFKTASNIGRGGLVGQSTELVRCLQRRSRRRSLVHQIIMETISFSHASYHNAVENASAREIASQIHGNYGRGTGRGYT